MNACSSLTLILACIIYWQAKEINRVLNECDPQGSGINLSLLEHISPLSGTTSSFKANTCSIET